MLSHSSVSAFDKQDYLHFHDNIFSNSWLMLLVPNINSSYCVKPLGIVLLLHLDNVRCYSTAV